MNRVFSFFCHRPAAVLLVALSLPAGCATSPPPRLYTFPPNDANPGHVVDDANASAYTVHVSPVRVPAYLDRPGIVTRRQGVEIYADPHHRWAMPLEEALTEVVSHALARELPGAFVDSNPNRGRITDGYSVRLHVTRLDGAPGESVTLEAQWRLYRSGHPAALRKVQYTLACADETYTSYIHTIQAAVLAMSEEIANAIRADRAL